MQEKAKQDANFWQQLLNYISQTVDEHMPKEVINEGNSPRIGHYVFQALLHPDNSEFDDIMWLNVFDIVHSRQLYSKHDLPKCFKYSSKWCRSQFPHAIVLETSFDETIAII